MEKISTLTYTETGIKDIPADERVYIDNLGLFVKGELNVLSAPSSNFKTFSVTEIVFSLLKTSKEVIAMIIDFDDGKKKHFSARGQKEVFLKYSQAKTLRYLNKTYLRQEVLKQPKAKTKTLIKYLFNFLEKSDLKNHLLIIDSLGDFADLKDPEAIMEFYDFLNILLENNKNLDIILLTHDRKKTQESDLNSFRGASEIQDKADTFWQLQADTTTSDEYAILKFSKGKNRGKTDEVKIAKLFYGKAGGEALQLKKRIQEPAEIKAKILAHLGEKNATAKEIAGNLGTYEKDRKFHAILKELQEHGAIIKHQAQKIGDFTTYELKKI